MEWDLCHLAEPMVAWLYGVGDMLVSLHNLDWHDSEEDKALRNVAMVHYKQVSMLEDKEDILKTIRY